jgi:hypothetical protein
MKKSSRSSSLTLLLALASSAALATSADAQGDDPGAGPEGDAAPPAERPVKHAAPRFEAPPESEPSPPPSKPAAPGGIQLADWNGWKIGIDGRLNAFVVYGWGNHNATTAPETGNTITPGIGTGISADNQIDTQGQFHTPRIRSGFVPNVLAFTLSKQVTEETTLSGRIALWSDVHSNVSVYINAQTYVQEGFLKLEGPWGSFTAGRQLALFNRGAIEIDFNYAHNFGVGWPCNFNGVLPACGQIGFGALFPFFRAGLVYATPSLGGFQVTAGAFDPVILAGKWERLIVPTFEAEAAFTQRLGNLGMFKLFGSALWQRLGGAANYVDPTPNMPSPPTDGRTVATKKVDQLGLAGGFRLELGPLRLGVTGHYGKGLGFFYAQENSQAAYYFADDAHDPRDGDLRTFRGFYGQLAFVLGQWMLATGAGASQLVPLSYDDTVLKPMPKQQLGVNGVVNYRVTDKVVFDVDVFRAIISWYGTAFEQTVWVVSAGPTVLF